MRKYRSQKNIEKTLLYDEINYANKILHNKAIKKVKFYSYGDIDLIINSNCKMQIINDTHLKDSVILRIVSFEKNDKFVSKSGKIYYFNEKLYDIVNGINNQIIHNNNLIK